MQRAPLFALRRKALQKIHPVILLLSATKTSLVILLHTTPVAAAEQKENNGKADDCLVLCAPELNFEPTLTVENLFAPPRVEDLATGEVTTLSREPVFELTLALDVPTAFPYIGFTFETIFPPIPPDNHVEFEWELNINFLLKQWTGGWLGSHFDVVLKLSPRERPDGESAYTPKLNLELDVGFYLFNWLKEGNWLRGVSLEASLDYVATGLQREGDEFDGERYLDRASGWSASFLLVIPVAPVRR